MDCPRMITLIFTLLLSQGIFSLILESNVAVQPNNLLLFDSFAFLNEGTFTFTFVAKKYTQKPTVLIMIIDEGINCDVIGKQCIYKLFKTQNLCQQMTAERLNNSVLSVFPIVLPSVSYVVKNYSDTLSLNLSETYTYKDINNSSLEQYINQNLTSSIQQQFPKEITINSTHNVSDEFPFIKKAISYFKGSVNKSTLYYFTILSCSNESYELSVNYELMNPSNENLPVTDLPYKYIHIICSAVWGAITLGCFITVFTEKYIRGVYRLMHFLGCFVSLSMVIMNIIGQLYWIQISVYGKCSSSMQGGLFATFLTVNLIYLLLVILVSTGAMFNSNSVMRKDFLVIAIIVLLYGVYAMLFELYGEIMSFFMALIYLICLIYVCKRSALLMSKMSSVIYDMEHATNIRQDLLLIPKRKLEVIYWFRFYSLLLFTLLIAGNLIAIILFINFQWIPELYNQGIEAINFIIIQYLFRSTNVNVCLYEQVPNVQPDMRVLQAFFPEEGNVTNPIFLATVLNPSKLYLVKLPCVTNGLLKIGLKKDEEIADNKT